MMCSLTFFHYIILYKWMCTCTYMYEFTQSSVFTCNLYAYMYVCIQYIGIAHSIHIFSPSVEMSSLLAEIFSRQEA